MNNMFKKVLLGAAVTCVVGMPVSKALAQATATININAEIVGALAIANPVGMDFGSISVGAGGGTVVLSTAGGATSGSGDTVPSGGSSAGSFDVTGDANRVVDISTSAASTTVTGPGAPMTVDAFSLSDGTLSDTGDAVTAPTISPDLGAGGAAAVTIGGTLTVAGSQVAGTYTGSIDVTAAYQ